MLYIRADGSAKTGAGHLMRGLTIADAAGGPEGVCFVCADEASAELAQKRGYVAWVLSGPAFSVREAEDICTLAGQGQVEQPVFLVDSYLASSEYLQQLARVGKVAYLDDLMERAYGGADWIINYNIYADHQRYGELYSKSVKQPEFLLGANYIPLRPQFYRGRTGPSLTPQVAGAVGVMPGILITTGGGDERNIAGRILETMTAGDGTAELEYHVVCGAFNPHRESLETFAAKRANIHLHYHVQDMAALMGECACAVTAGGTTVYELCAVGIPFVCFSYADNQEQLVQYIGRNEMGICAGDYRREEGMVLEEIRKGVLQLLENKETAKRYIQNAGNRVDGMGAGRIAECILGKVKK